MEEVQLENQDGDRDPLLILGKIEDMIGETGALDYETVYC